MCAVLLLEAMVAALRRGLAAHTRALNASGARDARGRPHVEAAWRVTRVGGARRRDARHDADFLVTHPTICSCARVGGVLDGLLTEVRGRRMAYWWCGIV